MQRLGEDLYCATWYTAQARHEAEGLDRKAGQWPGRGFYEPQLLSFAMLMVRALQHVHTQRVVHRDVKVRSFPSEACNACPVRPRCTTCAACNSCMA